MVGVLFIEKCACGSCFLVDHKYTSIKEAHFFLRGFYRGRRSLSNIQENAMNPTAATMPPATAAPSMGMPVADPTAMPPAAPDMQAMQALAAPPQDTFMPQQAAAAGQTPEPSPEEMAAMMSMLGITPGQAPGAAGQAPGAPGQAPVAPGMPGAAPAASSLQEVPGPNGGNMVLEQAPAAGPTGTATPSNSLKYLLGAAVVAGASFLGFRAWQKNKSVTEGAFDKLQKEADDVLDQIAQKLGLQDELEDLHAATIGRVKDSIDQHKAAINGIAEDAADLLEQKTEALFEHAKGLTEGASIQGKRVAREWKDAIENFKVKVLGQGDEEAAKAAD
jgi:hypothetical protein